MTHDEQIAALIEAYENSGRDFEILMHEYFDAIRAIHTEAPNVDSFEIIDMLEVKGLSNLDAQLAARAITTHYDLVKKSEG